MTPAAAPTTAPARPIPLTPFKLPTLPVEAAAVVVVLTAAAVVVVLAAAAAVVVLATEAVVVVLATEAVVVVLATEAVVVVLAAADVTVVVELAEEVDDALLVLADEAPVSGTGRTRLRRQEVVAEGSRL